jgi:hypothetical protein
MKHRLVLEGGSIDTNGAGVLLTTEECLLSEVQQRNPGVSREQLERAFHDFLASIRSSGSAAASPATTPTATSTTSPASSRPRHCRRRRAEHEATPTTRRWPKISARLKAARTLDGKQFDLVELPLPRPGVFRGQRLPASYANFYIANGLVLVPTFHDPNDRVALNILAEVFPGREVIGIHSVDLVWGLGTLHCMTQQQPAFDPELVCTFKRLNSFQSDDVELLAKTLKIFSALRTTPHVLTEVSNLANSLPKWRKDDWSDHFSQQIEVISEKWIPALTLAASPLMPLGLTDAGLASLASTHVILTIDFPLSNSLESRGLNVINFTHLRSVSLL